VIGAIAWYLGGSEFKSSLKNDYPDEDICVFIRFLKKNSRKIPQLGY